MIITDSPNVDIFNKEDIIFTIQYRVEPALCFVWVNKNQKSSINEWFLLLLWHCPSRKYYGIRYQSSIEQLLLHKSLSGLYPYLGILLLCLHIFGRECTSRIWVFGGEYTTRLWARLHGITAAFIHFQQLLKKHIHTGWLTIRVQTRNYYISVRTFRSLYAILARSAFRISSAKVFLLQQP